MPLPDRNEPIPPPHLAKAYRVIDEWAAWYQGDTARLTEIYAAESTRGNRENSRGITGTAEGSHRRRFWARPASEAGLRLHVPAAGDIASINADLLFGEAVGLNAPEDAEKASAARLEELVDLMELPNRLLESAEIASAHGGAYLVVAFDPTLFPHPVLSVVPPTHAIPEFRWGQLVEVTFVRVVSTPDDRHVWRHLENHRPGVIEHGLYRGDQRRVGTRVDLSEHPSTENLSESVTLPDGIMAAHHVPNMRPSRRLAPLAWGRSDIDGAEDLLDSLDEAWSSWMRDIRLGKARLIVPSEFLSRTGGRGGGAAFNTDGEVFTPLEMDPTSMDGKSPITPVEFKIRYQEHAETCNALYERILGNAGLSPQSAGLHIEGRAESGTALRIRERRSLSTQARKQRYYTPTIQRLVEAALSIDRAILNNRSGAPFRPTVEWADSYAPDLHELSQTVDLLRRAEAASTEVIVGLIHPDWTADEVTAEVKRIAAERSTIPDPFALDPDGDPDDGL